ncbi:MAG: rhodanese-like domain-containing protein [candidate division Zixibacteria bacterium]|nr:rhodanese-like domain-containing protein [candidate division Zixibacteria bacterium]NIW95234.1 ArsR family transcriptional regulator [Phycisphaerae bacterium]
MSEPIRITPSEARQKVISGQALLVCAYDDPEKFKKNHLEGALSFSELLAKLSALDKSQEIIFYCA